MNKELKLVLFSILFLLSILLVLFLTGCVKRI